MRWFKEELKDIYQPYNVRALYNKTKSLVLTSDLYDQVMAKLDELEKIHTNSQLDIDTINGIREDIEVDKESLIYMKKKREKEKLDFDCDEYRRTIKDNPLNPLGSVRSIEKKPTSKFESHGLVDIIIHKETKGLLEAVEREAILIALDQGKTRGESARILGISYRTLTNKIKKHFKNAN